MKDKSNPEGRKGETPSKTTLRTGRTQADRQAHAKQGGKADKVWLRGKGK